MSKSYDLGKLGEEIACARLRAEGCTIRETRWRFRHLELDIIADDGTNLIIAEVKTRSSLAGGLPEDAIDHKKIMRIVRAADTYIRMNYIDLPYRFDIFSIIIGKDGTPGEVTHLKDAFYPPLG